MSLHFRTAIASATAAVAFLITTQAFAAGTVTVTQESPIGLMGDYILTLPDATQVPSYDQVTRELDPAQTGTYTLRITPPADAHTLVTVWKNGLEQAAIASREVTFAVQEGEEVLVTIEYRYEGTIRVESDPVGMSFELLGPGNTRIADVAPATYTNVPPGTYRVTFHKREGCDLVAPMQRSLKPNQTLTFIGKFRCGVPLLPPVPLPIEPEEPIADVNEGRSLRIWAAAHQTEVLPGGVARVMLTVKNTGTRTVHDLAVSAQVDPTLLQMNAPLPRFGVLQGDTAVWETPELLAGKTWSVTLPFTVSENLKQGDRLLVTARVSGSDLEEGNAGMLLASTEIGVTTLPQTGMRFDILFVILSLIAAGTLAKRTVRRTAEQRA